MPAFRSVVSALVSNMLVRFVRSFSTARQRHDGHRGTGLTLHGCGAHRIETKVVGPAASRGGVAVYH
jgi:hypothetical protein